VQAHQLLELVGREPARVATGEAHEVVQPRPAVPVRLDEAVDVRAVPSRAW
jgi:hypothetical protein